MRVGQYLHSRYVSMSLALFVQQFGHPSAPDDWDELFLDLCRAFPILEILNLVNVQKISQAGGEAVCSEPWTVNGARLRLGERPSIWLVDLKPLRLVDFKLIWLVSWKNRAENKGRNGLACSLFFLFGLFMVLVLTAVIVFTAVTAFTSLKAFCGLWSWMALDASSHICGLK